MDTTESGMGSSKKNAARFMSTRILTAIAERDDRSIDDLRPLYEVIDPDALDALFAPRMDGSLRGGGSVSFPYAGYVVTVSSDGVVEIDPEGGQSDG